MSLMNFPSNFPKPNNTYFETALVVIKEFFQEQIEPSPKALNNIIKKAASDNKLNTLPLWVISWSYNHQSQIKLPKNKLELLAIKKVRSLSGIVTVSVFTKPFSCPGNCIFCPTQKDMPKSYLNDEPAIMRAVRNNWDPAMQVVSRLKQLKFSGHDLDKIELIVQGGTFSNLPKEYREEFIASCINAVNSFPNKPHTSSLDKAIKENENAPYKIVGITIETRPDWINHNEVKFLRKLGVTRIELGVQSIRDDILELSNRGHKITATIKATRLLKDVGLKICYHMMPGLPGSTLKNDEADMNELFTNASFQPDLLKIYPCVVTKHSQIEEWYKKDKFSPLGDNELKELLIAIKKNIPSYVRIQRLGRDIPATNIVAGSKVSNIRQVVLKELDSPCKCIRCREVKDSPIKTPRLNVTKYQASEGIEYFLEYMNPKTNELYSLLRLRLPSEPIFETLKNTAIIREVHTYGRQTRIGEKGNAQHIGLGRQLIQEAEKIAKQEGYPKIAIISGIGVRSYYRKIGYELEQTYMVKDL